MEQNFLPLRNSRKLEHVFPPKFLTSLRIAITYQFHCFTANTLPKNLIENQKR